MTIPVMMMMMIFAYVAGSLCSAILICRFINLPDPRTEGSHNPGASNMYRIGGKWPAIFTLILDILKGTIPMLCAIYLGMHTWQLGLVAVAACLGHIFPVFFGFKGGKGVATALGAILPLGANLVAMVVSSWLIVVYLWGYSSLAAVVTALLASLYTYWLSPEHTILVLMLAILVLLRHKENIIRLYQGSEDKLNAKQINRQQSKKYRVKR